MSALKSYPVYFSRIARLFIEDPDAFIHFRTHGFSALDWPACDGREVALQFERLADERSVEFAKLKLSDRALNLESVDQLPQEFDQIWNLAADMATYGIWEQTARAILADPMKGPEVVAQVRTGHRVEMFNVQDVILKHIEEQTELSRQGKSYRLTIPGWEELSKNVGGFNAGRVGFIVAETGAGKTTLAMNLLSSASKQFPVLMVNMEMETKDMLDRLLKMESGVEPEWLTDQPSLDTQSRTIDAARSVQNRTPFIMTDGRALTMPEITSAIIRAKEKHGVQIVIVDYDQKIVADNDSEEWKEILRAMVKLEELSKATETFIFVLAQGDENGMPKASKRAMQPCSCVLYLHAEGKGHWIESRKNRFGKKFKMPVIANLDLHQMKEGDPHGPASILPTPTKELKNHAKMFERKDING